MTTRFTHGQGDDRPTAGTISNWSLLAGELEERTSTWWCAVELPGLDKEDCEVIPDGNTLYVSGESIGANQRQHLPRHGAYGFFSAPSPPPRNALDEAHQLQNGSHCAFKVAAAATGSI
jgi:HSP20 family protein